MRGRFAAVGNNTMTMSPGANGGEYDQDTPSYAPRTSPKTKRLANDRASLDLILNDEADSSGFEGDLGIKQGSGKRRCRVVRGRYWLMFLVIVC